MIIHPFNIKYRQQIELKQCQIMTLASEPVEIVKWNCRGKYPILAVIFDGDTDDCCFYTNEGISADGDRLYILLNE